MLNEISQRFKLKFCGREDPEKVVKNNESEGDINDQGIKFVSAIDSKPVRPGYLKLTTLEDYLQAQNQNESTQIPSTLIPGKKP